MPTTTTRIAAAAAEGRSTFVDRTLNDFVEQSGMSVSNEVHTYILGSVLRPDSDWEAGVNTNSLDPEQTHAILIEALYEAGDEYSMMQSNRPFEAHSTK